MYVCMWYFGKIDHCIHIHWWIVMGLGHNDPWVESHMWPQQTWGQRSSRGQWPLVQVFGKKGQCIHILCIFKSNVTMIAKVCDRESRRDSWFENRLVQILRGHNWAHFSHSKLCYLKNLKLLSIRVKELFEPIALREKRRQVFCSFLKAFFLRNRSLSNAKWFYGKNAKLGKEICIYLKID